MSASFNAILKLIMQFFQNDIVNIIVNVLNINLHVTMVYWV